MSVEKHIDDTVSHIRNIFEKISARIEAIPAGNKILATELAESVAKDYGMTGAQIYPVFLYIIRGYPGIEQKRGAKGGIYKLTAAQIREREAKESEPELILPMAEPEDLPELFDGDKILPIVNT